MSLGYGHGCGVGGVTPRTVLTSRSVSYRRAELSWSPDAGRPTGSGYCDTARRYDVGMLSVDRRALVATDVTVLSSLLGSLPEWIASQNQVWTAPCFDERVPSLSTSSVLLDRLAQLLSRLRMHPLCCGDVIVLPKQRETKLQRRPAKTET